MIGTLLLSTATSPEGSAMARRPAIGLSDNGGKTQLLLDPQTYQVIGMRAASTGTDPVRTIAGKGRKVPWPPKGTIIESMAWAQVTMVSGPGRL